MTTALDAGRYLRFVWHSATWRDRASLLVIAWLVALTLVSIMFGELPDTIAKIIWLLAFAVVGWGMFDTIVERVVQAAVTEEFVAQVAAETQVFGQSHMAVQFADMTYTFVSGYGWQKAKRPS